LRVFGSREPENGALHRTIHSSTGNDKPANLVLTFVFNPGIFITGGTKNNNNNDNNDVYSAAVVAGAHWAYFPTQYFT